MSTRTLSWITELVSYAHVLVLWKDPKSLPLGARSFECDNKRTKIDFVT